MKHNGNYVNLDNDANGNLVITLNPEAEEIREKMEENCYPYEAIYELLEDIVCNSDMEVVQPEEVGALTDSIIIAEEVERDDEGTLTNCGNVYWFPHYQVFNPIHDLFKDGKVIFEKAEKCEE